MPLKYRELRWAIRLPTATRDGIGDLLSVYGSVVLFDKKEDARYWKVHLWGTTKFSVRRKSRVVKVRVTVEEIE